MKSIKTILPLFLMFLSTCVNTQLTVDAKLRSGFEYLHGFKTLFPMRQACEEIFLKIIFSQTGPSRDFI